MRRYIEPGYLVYTKVLNIWYIVVASQEGRQFYGHEMAVTTNTLSHELIIFFCFIAFIYKF